MKFKIKVKDKWGMSYWPKVGVNTVTKEWKTFNLDKKDTETLLTNPFCVAWLEHEVIKIKRKKKKD